MTSSPAGLLQFLQQVPDPRGRQGQRHPHTAMLAVIVSAMLCNFQSYEAVAQWIRLLPIEVWHAFGGKWRPPCANTFRDLMNAISPDALEKALMQWVTKGLGLKLQLDERSGIIIDGKVLRGTRSDHRRTQQILAAIDQHTGCVLSETHIDENTNEAKTALRFLKRLVLKGKVVVGDAAYCQRDVCKTVLSEHSDYLVLIKDNQPTLHKEAIQAFVIPEGFPPLCQTQST